MTVSAKETTARPWAVTEPEGYRFQIKSGARIIAETSWHDRSPYYPTESQAKANFNSIVQAVNEREALLAERDALREALEAAEDMYQRGIFNMGISEIDRVHELRRTALSQFRQETK